MTTTPTTIDLAAMVRAGDYARFLVIQLSNPLERKALYALTAFAIEMQRIPTLIQEPMAGFLRYAWWREALEEIASGKPARHHPILQAIEPLATSNPPAFAQCFRMLESAQMAMEGDELVDVTTALNAGWQAVNGEKSLQALPIIMENGHRTRIGPWRILRLIAYGLRHSTS